MSLDARAQLRIWLAEERRGHADTKYNPSFRADQEGGLTIDDGALSDGSWWMRFIPNYLSRVQMLKLSTPRGRQAMGKLITTLCNCLEVAIDLYGDMPQPGCPSGEIRPWRRLVAHGQGELERQQT